MITISRNKPGRLARTDGAATPRSHCIIYIMHVATRCYGRRHTGRGVSRKKNRTSFEKLLCTHFRHSHEAFRLRMYIYTHTHARAFIIMCTEKNRFLIRLFYERKRISDIFPYNYFGFFASVRIFFIYNSFSPVVLAYSSCPPPPPPHVQRRSCAETTLHATPAHHTAAI